MSLTVLYSTTYTTIPKVSTHAAIIVAIEIQPVFLQKTPVANLSKKLLSKLLSKYNRYSFHTPQLTPVSSLPITKTKTKEP